MRLRAFVAARPRLPLLLSALALAAGTAPTAQAKDDLLEVLAQNGTLSPEEYEKLKNQRKSDLSVVTDDGFRIQTTDGAFSLQPGTLQQVDFAAFRNDARSDLPNGTDLRRSRLSLSGVLFKDFQYRFEQEFASAVAGVTDAYVSYSAHRPLVVTAGQFKVPFSMESLAADKGTTFMERGLPFAFITVRAPGVGVNYSGTNYSLGAGVFGEPLTSAQAGDEGISYVARGTFVPYAGPDALVHLGAAYAYRNPTSENSTNATGPKFSTVRFRSRPESNEIAQRLVDTGEIPRVDYYNLEGVELAAQRGPLSLQGEYMLTQVRRENNLPGLDFNGWYGQVAYTLTGEPRPYKVDKGAFDGVKPARNFGAGGWGAFEVAGRVSGLDLVDKTINGGNERNVAAALNWYLNPFLRTSFNFVKVLSIKGGPYNNATPNIFEARLQLAL